MKNLSSPRRSRLPGRGFMLAAAIALTAFGFAAPQFLGDVNEDEAINVADVVSIVNVLQPFATPSPVEQLLADANDDGTLDDTDAAYAIDVTLQLAEPLPLSRQSPTAAASFWRPIIDRTISENDSGFEHTASFWRQVGDPLATEDNAFLEAPTSLERQLTR